MVWRAIAVGGGLALDGPARGHARAIFARALALRVGDEDWALVSAPGLLSARAILVPALPEALVGDAVAVRAGRVSVGRSVVDCRGAAVWHCAGWPRVAPGFPERLAVVEAAARGRAWEGSVGLAAAVVDGLRRGEPGPAVARCVGRGPGMTPSGDDVLVGIFAGLVLGGLGPAEGLRAAVAPLLASTGEVSARMLVEAGRGEIGRGLCDLGRVLWGGGDIGAALSEALAVGASSGADAAVGLATAARGLVLVEEGFGAW